MKKVIQIIAVAACAMAICSCQKEGPSVISSEVSPIENSAVAARAEFSSMLENILSDESTSESITALILENGGVMESLTFDQILSLKNKSDERTAGLSRAFCDAVVTEIASNTAKYPIAARKTAILTKGGDVTDSDLKNLDFELYIPYSEYHDADEEDEVTIIYAPEDELATEVDGVKVNRAGEKIHVGGIDDEYTKENMTIAILPLDTLKYTPPKTDEEFMEEWLEWYERYKGRFHIGKPGRGDVDNDEEENEEDEPALPDGLITVNVTDSETIDEDDILYTNLAHIRVKNDSWCGFISNKLKLVIYRTSADYELDDNNIPEVSPGQHMVARYEIPKSQIRNGEWIAVNTIFDDDWDLHEYDQEIFFCSEHNLRMGSAEMSGEVSLGYTEEKGFCAEAGMSAKFSYTVGGLKLRANNELTRKSILATNLSDMGAGTREIQGHDYAVRSYGGVVDLVFTQYYTHYDD